MSFKTKMEEQDDQQSAPPPLPPPLPPPPPSASAGQDGELGRTWSETIFPMKLYDILCNPEYSRAIAWMPHGRSWKVLDKDYFMAQICPQYFAQTRYESFIRQVNGWGFKRMRREGPDRSSYYHEHFLRGYPNMIDHMRRPAPGEKSRDLREEPDFYVVPAMPQLPTPPPRESTQTGPARSTIPPLAKKVGRPAGSVTSAGTPGAPPMASTPRSQSSFEAVVPRTGEPHVLPPHPYQNPYMMQGSPWNPPPHWPYPGYPPPTSYWGQPPPHPHSAWRAPPMYPPGYYAYAPGKDPAQWPPAAGTAGGPQQPSQMTIAYPFPMYDPSQYYGAYPHTAPPQMPQLPSTPQPGAMPRQGGWKSAVSGASKTTGEESLSSGRKRKAEGSDHSHEEYYKHSTSGGSERSNSGLGASSESKKSESVAKKRKPTEETTQIHNEPSERLSSYGASLNAVEGTIKIEGGNTVDRFIPPADAKGQQLEYPIPPGVDPAFPHGPIPGQSTVPPAGMLAMQGLPSMPLPPYAQRGQLYMGGQPIMHQHPPQRENDESRSEYKSPGGNVAPFSPIRSDNRTSMQQPPPTSQHPQSQSTNLQHTSPQLLPRPQHTEHSQMPTSLPSTRQGRRQGLTERRQSSTSNEYQVLPFNMPAGANNPHSQTGDGYDFADIEDDLERNL